MKNKNKVIILSAILASGAIAATAAIVPSVLKNKSSKSNINNIIETNEISFLFERVEKKAMKLRKCVWWWFSC